MQVWHCVGVSHVETPAKTFSITARSCMCPDRLVPEALMRARYPHPARGLQQSIAKQS